MYLDRLFKLMAEKQASDLFISCGAPMSMKINGVVMPLTNQRMDIDTVRRVAYELMNEEQAKIFDTEFEMNLSHLDPAVGNFRINIFRQRGTISLVIRYVRSDIPPFDELKLPPVLLELVMEKRGLVLIAGATGSGKSTTLGLLHRAFDPQSGAIRIDGDDIRDICLASLRRNIGVVFQEPMLFARSIRENLQVGRPEASDEEMIQALERAQALEFINRQAEGLDTSIGERGRSLSGGERQRLSIARALLKNPPVLILDEATSALDAATERKLQLALEEVMKGRTTFVIAHRLATIRNADRILVFDQGRIIETGTFDELVAKGGRFAELARAQFMAGEARERQEAQAADVVMA